MYEYLQVIWGITCACGACLFGMYGSLHIFIKYVLICKYQLENDRISMIFINPPIPRVEVLHLLDAGCIGTQMGHSVSNQPMVKKLMSQNLLKC